MMMVMTWEDVPEFVLRIGHVRHSTGFVAFVGSAYVGMNFFSQRWTEDNVESGRERQVEEKILSEEEIQRGIISIMIVDEFEWDEKVEQMIGKVSEEQPQRLTEKRQGDFMGERLPRTSMFLLRLDTDQHRARFHRQALTPLTNLEANVNVQHGIEEKRKDEWMGMSNNADSVFGYTQASFDRTDPVGEVHPSKCFDVGREKLIDVQGETQSSEHDQNHTDRSWLK